MRSFIKLFSPSILLGVVKSRAMRRGNLAGKGETKNA
jgi:hypothetical protein